MTETGLLNKIILVASKTNQHFVFLNIITGTFKKFSFRAGQIIKELGNPETDS